MAVSRGTVRPHASWFVLDEAPEESGSVVLAHQADARIGLLRALHRNDPGEALRRNVVPEMHFDIAAALRLELELRGTEIRGRHAEAEPAVQRVVGATRKNAGARIEAAGPRRDRDAVRG